MQQHDHHAGLEVVPEWVQGLTPEPAMLAHIRPLSRFEVAAVAGRRAAELASGAPSTMVGQELGRWHAKDPVSVAIEEVKSNQLPDMRVFRYMPDGSHVTVHVRDANRGFDRRVRYW